MKGHLIVLSGPSGVGKNAVEMRLRKILPSLERVVTYTTRKARPNEKNGIDYHFTTKQHLQDMIDSGEMLEWAVVHDQLYGVNRKDVERMIDEGKILLMIIDVQGAVTVKTKLDDAHLIFLEPESISQLKKHLAKRKKMTDADLKLRLANAEKEMAMRDFYDFAVVNKEGKLDETADQVAKIIKQIIS